MSYDRKTPRNPFYINAYYSGTHRITIDGSCRQVKEREVEDHLFGDKEKFVTAAYKKKLQERQLWEAEQKLKCVAAGCCMRSCMTAHVV